MSILIKGMEMPTEGGTIVVYKISGNYFAARAGKDELCPLVPVPPHGRLIDAGKLRELYEEWENDKEAGIDIDKCHVPIPVIRQNIDDAPTAIEAEEPSGNSGELED